MIHPDRLSTLRLACFALATLLALGACTVARLEHDSTQALEWLRLKHGAEVQTAARWQLPRYASIQVVELAPAPDPAWLQAAQQGIDAVFPAPSVAGGAHFQLLVAWPEGESAPAADDARRRLDRFLPDLQGPFTLRVALVRSTDGALVDAAALEVSPRWLSGRDSAPGVRTAFQRFAEGFRPGY
ncbi:MAG TPA: hypothetical protein VF210_11385 [Pseudomonadales bacterium]